MRLKLKQQKKKKKLLKAFNENIANQCRGPESVCNVVEIAEHETISEVIIRKT